MEILLTNDDGWGARGIEVLLHEIERLGHVTVLAPDSARSGMSNAVSFAKPLTLRLVESTAEHDIYVTNGTPSDCVKLALNIVYQGRRPNLLVSGINHGSNAAVNVIYSGTMGACFVGAEQGIPSIGFSLCDHLPDADFSELKQYILPLTKELLERGFPDRVCYNINAPIGHLDGYRYTRQSRGYWDKEMGTYYDEKGEPYYLLQGEFVNTEPDAEDTDEWALAHHLISICPTTIDMTAKV